jgi:membrane-bound serine protease (ClpP class)
MIGGARERTIRLLVGALAVGWALFLPVNPAISKTTPESTIELITVEGAVHDTTVRFILDTIDTAARTRHPAQESKGNVELVVLMIDSPGVVADPELFAELVEVVRNPPLPVGVWVGPAPAVAYGGMAQLVSVASLRAAAPGVEIGNWRPTLVGEPGSPPLEGAFTSDVDVIKIDGPVPGLIDLSSSDTASPRQLLQLLDGATFELREETITLATTRPFISEDGTEGVTVLETVLRSPGLWTQLVGLSTRPEVAFFFLMAGLTVAVFEFFAVGPGVAAVVAAISLSLGAYGPATLPLRWWALVLMLAGVGLLAFSYQRGGVLFLSSTGMAAVAVSGLFLFDTAPQITLGWAGWILTVAAVAFFFLLAMPTVARVRFSSPAIGREELIGEVGKAVTNLGPDGIVEVAGGKWKATSHRAANLHEGDDIVVEGVEGDTLEVGPAGDR